MRVLADLVVSRALFVVAALCLAACSGSQPESGAANETVGPPTGDPHSFARPEEVVVHHMALELEVDFATHRIHGRATLEIENKGEFETLFLDSAGLEISEVVLEPDARPTEFVLGPETPYLGRELAIAIEPDTRAVTVGYSTSPDATAIQWLEPAQTRGARQPFLFTQSQSIYARTWIPCQDTPSVRTTYEAVVVVPPGLMALMSAENGTEPAADGIHRFVMSQPVPSYLLALAVGELEFRSIGPRTGVYAEPEIADAAAWEFAGLEDLMETTEDLFGPYRWGRYDILVLPPSFPYGGMENPRLTFATPTILAGDRSLFSLIAHEVAHSWSGNLVTNSTWNDFWLNEGFTSYLEYRIMEALEGVEYAEMLRELGRQDLLAEIEEIGSSSPDTHLALDLAGRDPELGSTGIAYEKGCALLTLLEQTWGRERWDAFLRDYFDAYAFRSIDTRSFVEYLEEELFAEDPELARSIRLDEWIDGPGLPENVVAVESPAFTLVEDEIAAWEAGRPAAELSTVDWSTHEWLHFVRHLPENLDPTRMAELDGAFGFTTTRNSEIAAAWLLQAIRQGYAAADPALEAFLLEVGRSKFLRPLYGELATTPEGRVRAREIYDRARGGYHPLARAEVERVLELDGSEAE